MIKITFYLAALMLLLVSCSKEVIQPTVKQTSVEVEWRYGKDNMLWGSAMYCYPKDTYRTADTVLYFNSMHPDTTAMYKDAITRTKTGRVDSSFVYAGELVNLVGDIYHREYNGAVGKIKKITYGIGLNN